MGDRTRVSRKRMFLEQANPEFQSIAKLPRLHAPESLMPPPLSEHKEMICSCPPFECLCRPVPNQHADAFLGQNPMLHPFGQPTLLSPTALSFGGPGPNPFESFDHTNFQQPLMRDTYSEYFDLSPLDRLHSQGFSSFEPTGHVKSEPMMVPSHDLYSKPKPNLSIQDCMYSSNACSVSPNQQPEPILPTYTQSHTRSEPSTPPSSVAGVVPASPYQTTVTPASSYNSPPHYSLSRAAHTQYTPNNNSLITTSPQVPDLSPHTLDQFEFNDAADFLSLDQPINKELPAPACATSNRKPSISSSDVTKGATSDLSALLGLPSISSFLGEEGEGDNSANEHIDKILGLSLNYGEGSPESHKSTTDSLSPASSSDQKVPSEGSPLSPCRGPTPPSLTELQPLKTNNSISSPKKFSDIFQTGKHQSDLHPLTQDNFNKTNFHLYPEHSASRLTSYFSSKQLPEEQANMNWHSDMLFPPQQGQQQQGQQHQQQQPFNNHSINITLTYN